MKSKSKSRRKDVEWSKIIPLAAVIIGIVLFSLIFVVVSYRLVIGINVGGLLAYVVTDAGKYGMILFILLAAVFVGMGIAIIDHNEKRRARENSHLW